MTSPPCRCGVRAASARPTADTVRLQGGRRTGVRSINGRNALGSVLATPEEQPEEGSGCWRIPPPAWSRVGRTSGTWE